MVAFQRRSRRRTRRPRSRNAWTTKQIAEMKNTPRPTNGHGVFFVGVQGALCQRSWDSVSSAASSPERSGCLSTQDSRPDR